MNQIKTKMSIVHLMTYLLNYWTIHLFLYLFLIWAVSVLHTKHMQIVRTVQSRATCSLLVPDFMQS